MERVYIQKKKGEFVTVNGWVAWSGFDQKAYSITFFEWPELRDGVLKITPHTLVVGGVGTVLHALRRLGITPPNLDFPDSIRKYLGRTISSTTMGAVRALLESENPTPVFVKPREIHKAFTGYVVSAFRDLIPTAAQPDDLAVWTSEIVEFHSEWRYFVRHNEVVGLGHYQGDPFIHPETSIVQAAVDDFRVEAPAAYAIDFGITSDGRTLLVEVNDAYSLGHIGLRAVTYANMLETRWKELTVPS